MGMAAAAVIPHFAGTDLVPCLCHGKDEAIAIEHLKRERRVGGNLRHKAGVGISFRVEHGRPVGIGLSQRDFAENTMAFVGVVEVLRSVVEEAAGIWTVTAV